MSFHFLDFIHRFNTSNQFIQCFVLSSWRLVVLEVSNQSDSHRIFVCLFCVPSYHIQWSCFIVCSICKNQEVIADISIFAPCLIFRTAFRRGCWLQFPRAVMMGGIYSSDNSYFWLSFIFSGGVMNHNSIWTILCVFVLVAFSFDILISREHIIIEWVYDNASFRSFRSYSKLKFLCQPYPQLEVIEELGPWLLFLSCSSFLLMKQHIEPCMYYWWLLQLFENTCFSLFLPIVDFYPYMRIVVSFLRSMIDTYCIIRTLQESLGLQLRR